ncbi:MAG: hypothetical protein ABW046_21320 [Actinoplanes sp.]
MTTDSLDTNVEQWRVAGLDLLEIARTAGPLTPLEIPGTLFFSEPASGFVGNRTQAFLQASKEVAARTGGTGALPVLLGALEVGSTLLAAADQPSPMTAAAPTALNELADVLRGNPTTAPDAVTDRLEALETAGADELLALGRDAILIKALGGAVTKLAELGGPQVKKAFDKLEDTWNVVRKAAARILKWVVDELRNLVPKEFQDRFDAALQQITDAIKDGVPAAAGNLLGRVLGRRETEAVWQAEADRGVDLTKAEAALPIVIAGHLTRIGYVTTARKHAALAVIVIRRIPQANLVLAALGVSLIAFVMFQVWDGFNDISALATP